MVMICHGVDHQSMVFTGSSAARRRVGTRRREGGRRCWDMGFAAGCTRCRRARPLARDMPTTDRREGATGWKAGGHVTSSAIGPFPRAHPATGRAVVNTTLWVTQVLLAVVFDGSELIKDTKSTERAVDWG